MSSQNVWVKDVILNRWIISWNNALSMIKKTIQCKNRRYNSIAKHCNGCESTVGWFTLYYKASELCVLFSGLVSNWCQWPLLLDIAFLFKRDRRIFRFRSDTLNNIIMFLSFLYNLPLFIINQKLIIIFFSPCLLIWPQVFHSDTTDDRFLSVFWIDETESIEQTNKVLTNWTI